jgi:hypothetical protein
MHNIVAKQKNSGMGGLKGGCKFIEGSGQQF